MLSERRDDFAAKGIKLIAISSQSQNWEEFKAAVWKDDDVFVDEDDAFKKALGGGQIPQYRNMWLLKPSVVLAIARSMKWGTGSDLNAKTSSLGGTILVQDDVVRFAQTEDSTFNYAPVDEVLGVI